MSDLLKIETALDDLLMPYKIDLSIIEHIKNAELLEHIKRIGMRLLSAQTSIKKPGLRLV